MSSNDPSNDDVSSCLVARAVPCRLPSQKILDPEIEAEEQKSADASADSLAETFQKLQVDGGAGENKKPSSIKKPLRVADPADFVTLQSLKSSALARKTNTTFKFGRDGANLFADLLATDTGEAKKPSSQKPVEAAVSPKKSPSSTQDTKGTKPTEKVNEESARAAAEKPDKENKDDKKTKEEEEVKNEEDLLARGPVRAARAPTNFHPYGGSRPYPNSNESFDQVCAPFGDPSAMNSHYDYQAGQHWSTNNFHGREMLSSNNSTPDTVISSYGYASGASSSASPHHQQCTSSAYFGATANSCGATVLPAKEDGELPDALSDFILKYSRSYRGSDGPPSVSDSGYDENSSVTQSPRSGRPPSADSQLCSSPLGAGSAPESSPAAPNGGMTGPSTPLSDYRGCNKMGPLRTALPSGQYTAYVNRQNGGQPAEQHARPAKEVLRRLISAEEMDDAWAWTCKCMQNYPGALCYQDKDKDTLLHIVTMHTDLAKIYALVEQMLKTEYAGHQKPFDMKNRYNETPLFLAVKQRNNAVVDYLLEAGADPNCQNSRSERDTILHYAAAHGMPEIVKTICSYNTTNMNSTNGMGLTPLLLAVKNHGVYEEQGDYVTDNSQTIRFLLKFGADALISDATDGKNAVHFVVDRMAPEIIDIFKENLDEDIMTTLVNQPDNNQETALAQVQSLPGADESVRFKLCLSLIMCGAANGGSESGESP